MEFAYNFYQHLPYNYPSVDALLLITNSQTITDIKLDGDDNKDNKKFERKVLAKVFVLQMNNEVCLMLFMLRLDEG